MLGIIGTVPDETFPLVEGPVVLEDGHISVGGLRVAINRGTPALLAAAVRAGEVLGLAPPTAFLVGDVGQGKGSRRLYEYLTGVLPSGGFDVLAFHYLQPDVDWHNKVLFSIEAAPRRPFLIADAGFMYAAKMSGQAEAYDLFTPDVGELAFLADEEAPHPFYTRGFILHEENRIPDLIAWAYSHGNAARCLLVKGEKDYLAARDGVRGQVEGPREETLEAIGGTGDTLTALAAALVESGLDVWRAGLLAARANRLAGRYARPTPATQVLDIIEQIPRALAEVLAEDEKEKGSCKATTQAGLV